MIIFRKKLYRNLIISFSIILFSTLLPSCSHEAKPVEEILHNSASTTIQLNFNENIGSLHPNRVTNKSEIFISSLIFETLISKEGTSSIIESYTLDSLENTYKITINENKKFSDGSDVTSLDIKHLFKYLIKEKFDHAIIGQFFRSLDGFPSINWYRNNRSLLDSLPKGFQIIDNKHFSLKLNKKSRLVFDIFSNLLFTIYKESNNVIFGTGPYRLSQSNEDVLYQLKYKIPRSGHINTINIQFIKNEDVQISEFMKMELDLIFFNPVTSQATVHFDTLVALIDKNYPEFNVFYSNRGLLQYAIIEIENDTLLLQHILKSMSAESLVLSSGLNKLINLSRFINSDTSSLAPKYEVSLVDESSFLKKKHFYSYDSAKVSFTENTPSLNIITIKEIQIDFMNSASMENTLKKLNAQLNFKNDNNQLLIILGQYPDFIISNNSLYGLKDYEKLSDMIPHLYFSNPKLY